MSDLIKREDALALVEQWFATDNHLYSIILNDITNLPAIDPAATREAALREALEIAKACERQNYARITDDEKHGFYRAGLRSAGQAIAAAINAHIEKGATE